MSGGQLALVMAKLTTVSRAVLNLGVAFVIKRKIISLQDKYLHTNCLAALANMSSHFNALNLDAAQKIVT